MSDCHFGVSPVNYPDPDPEVKNPVSLSKNTGKYTLHGWLTVSDRKLKLLVIF